MEARQQVRPDCPHSLRTWVGRFTGIDHDDDDGHDDDH